MSVGAYVIVRCNRIFSWNSGMVKKFVVAIALYCVTFSLSAHITQVEFKDASIKDATRILAKMAGANISVTSEVANLKVDLLLSDVSLKHAVETMARISGAWYRYDKRNNSYLIMTEKQYQDSIVVYRDDIIKSFILKHQNVKATALTIQSLFGDRVVLNLQEELDDFEGIPDDYMQTLDESSESDSGGSGSSRVSVSRSTNGLIGTESFTLIDKSESVENVLANEDFIGKEISAARLRSLGGNVEIDADKKGKSLGLKTPVFITVNRIHNLMFVRTSDEQVMEDIEQLIEASDRPTPQVLLEMKIVKIGDSEGYDQDFDLSFNDSYNIDGVAYEEDSLISDMLSGVANLEFADGLGIGGVTQALNQIAGNSITKFGFNAAQGGFYEFYSKYINAKVEFLETKAVAETIAKPILLASNNRPSRLFIGEDQVVATGIDGGSINQVDNGNTTSTTETETELETEVKKIGSTLALLPSVNEDRTVTIDIFQSTSSLKRQGMNFPFYNTETGLIDSVLLDTVEESTIKTIVVAKDGYTIALGGMINESEKEESSSVPILGDIPFIGELFKTKSDAQSSDQYVILITPHIIMTPGEAVAKSKEIDEVDFNQYGDDSTTADAGVTLENNRAYQISDYIYLSRYAANDQEGQVASDAGVDKIPVLPEPISNVFESELLFAKPVSSYRKNGLFVTVVNVINTSENQQRIDLKRLSGVWLAATQEQPILAAYKQQIRLDGVEYDDSTNLYLVSNKSFERVLSNIR